MDHAIFNGGIFPDKEKQRKIDIPSGNDIMIIKYLYWVIYLMPIKSPVKVDVNNLEFGNPEMIKDRKKKATALCATICGARRILSRG